MKLLIDTDVLRSGLQSSGGASRGLLRAVGQRVVVPVVSVALTCEYEAVLKRAETLRLPG